MTTLMQRLRTLKGATLVAIGLAATSSTAIAGGLQDHIKVKADATQSASETTTRASASAKWGEITLSALTADAYDPVTKKTDEHRMIMVGTGPVTSYVRVAGDVTQAGADLALSGKGIVDSVYVCPVYVHVKDGKAFGNSLVGRATFDLGKGLEADVAYDHEMRWETAGNPDGKDSHAGYVGVRSSHMGVAVGQTYDGSVRGDFGFSATGIGGLVDVVYNHDTKDKEASILVAENPKGAVPSKDGAKVTQEVFTIGEFDETKTHLTPPGEKTLGGLVGKVKVAEKDGLVVFTPEIGFHTGDGLSVTIGETIPEKGQSVGMAKIAYTVATAFGTGKVEGTVTRDGVTAIYVSFSN